MNGRGYLPRLVAEAIQRAMVQRIGDRVKAELVPRFVRLVRSGHQREAEAFWSWGTRAICREELAATLEQSREQEVAGSA